MRMRRVLTMALYLGLAAMANPASADIAAAKAAAEGDMRKLTFHDAPDPLPDIAVIDADGGEVDLADYRGNHVVLNFWATWCAPCRHEMPTLSALDSHFAGRPVEVVTVATGRNSPQGIRRFFDEIGVENLPEYRDPSQALARQMGILGLPITVILDPEGREIARLRGDADWASASAKAVLSALSGGAGG
jgi:thiol-disulfide isomerase/thioredoxin